ncbi:hypothetical protein JCM8547_009167 [Rhodosporidiobolus lusitaniae]
MKLHMPSASTRFVTGAVALASLSGFCFGYDTGSVGSLTTMDSFYAEFGHISETLRGVVVSMILIPSAISGIFAGSISDKLSRKRAIALGAAIFAVGQAVSCCTFRYIGVLVLGRLIAGTGEGIFLGTLSVYVSEISPKHTRGFMLVLTQSFICLGVSCGFFTTYGTSNLQPSSISWRLPFAINASVALFIAFTAPFLPYSPRWLLMHNRRSEAEAVLAKLCGDGPVAMQERRELLAAGDAALADKGAERSKRAGFKRMWQKEYRWRTVLGTCINTFQMLSGIDFILFYAPLLYEQAGMSSETAKLASGITGILLILSTFVTAAFIQKVGRRPIFLWGGVSTATCLMVIGILYASGAAYASGKWAVIVFIELYAFVFGVSWASVVRLYANEIQPSATRAAAGSFGQGCNQAVNFAVALTGPVFLQASSVGPYFFYGAWTVLATVFAVFAMPETRGKSLEEIDQMFTQTSIPLAVALPSFMTSSSSPLANARLAVSDKVREHRQRRTSRSQSQSLGGEEAGINLRQRRPSRRRSSAGAGSGISPARPVGDTIDEYEEDGFKEDPRAAFRREMMAVGTLGKGDSAIDE